MPNDEKNIDLDPIDFRGKNVKKNKKRFTAFCYSCIVRFDSLVIKSWHFFNNRSFSYTQISDFENFDLHIFFIFGVQKYIFFRRSDNIQSYNDGCSLDAPALP